MSPIGKVFFILILFYTQVKARQIPRFSGFTKNQSFHDKEILIGRMQSGAVTENQSFVYAICDVEEKSKEYNCTVNVEAPAFYNASHKDTCIVNIRTEKPDQKILVSLLLQAFGDDKVIFSWRVKDSDFKTIMYKVHIIRMNTCKHQEVTFPSTDVIGITPNGNNFEMFVDDKTYCSSSNRCRLTFDSDGKKLSGPVPFLSNIEASLISTPTPANPRQASNEFFFLAVNETNMNNSKIFYANAEGKGTYLLTVTNPQIIRMSNSHEAITFCYSTEQTNITCQLYDLKASLKLTVFFEFVDEPVRPHEIVRWLQPHNLQDGGFLLVTGATHSKSPKLESFSVIKVNPNGQKERPLVIDDVDFECFELEEIYVSVSENNDDEVCFHFICKQRVVEENGYINSLKFSAKCFPQKFMSLYHTSSIN